MKQKLEVLEGCHNSALGGGHFGRDKTLKKVTERFYWLGIVDDVKEFCRTIDSLDEPRNWDLFLDSILFSYRVSCQDSTKHSPFPCLWSPTKIAC